MYTALVGVNWFVDILSNVWFGVNEGVYPSKALIVIVLLVTASTGIAWATSGSPWMIPKSSEPAYVWVVVFVGVVPCRTLTSKLLSSTLLINNHLSLAGSLGLGYGCRVS